MAISRLFLLLAAAGALSGALGQQACNVAPAGSAQDLYYPGLFDGGQAPLTGGQNCSDPLAIQPNSEMPFWFGAASASYQVEGATTEGGRGPSIWDTFVKVPGHIFGNQTGDVAVDFYHRFLEDIQLMRALGIRNYRMSLSWPRLFPNGTGELNQAGVNFYNNVIDALIANCIEPQLTVFHWDLPQALEDEYGGWLSERIVPDFVNYAETAFSLFGDRVKIWTTINEPQTICENGYDNGVMAPGHCSNRTKCPEGNSTTEPHICARNILLAHSAAVPVFRQVVPDGKVSLNTNLAPFYMPLTNDPNDVNATNRLNAFRCGWFLDPLFTGDWTPERLQSLPAEVLPRWTPQESAQLKQGKPDYLAVNFYNGAYGYFDVNATNGLQANSTTNNSAGVPLPVADSPWLYIFPASFRAALTWAYNRYENLPVTVTENGVDVPNEDAMPLAESLCDTFRVDFFRQYLGNASLAKTQDGVDLQGYFAWSLMDNFEWPDGYSKRFGIVHVDYPTQNRYYKASALWLSNLFGLTTTKDATQTVMGVLDTESAATTRLSTPGTGPVSQMSGSP
ncbi:hypothetical protein N2152v2_007775 [Parachlorella kessleri]